MICGVRWKRKLLLVGQAPSARTEGLAAFSGDSGRRIAKLLGDAQLAERVDAVNLLAWWPGRSLAGKGDAFPLADAREAATRELLGQHRVVLLAGRGVAAAFGVDADYFAWVRLYGRDAAVIPHPSGVSYWWNQADNVLAAARFLAQAVERARRGGRR